MTSPSPVITSGRKLQMCSDMTH